MIRVAARQRRLSSFESMLLVRISLECISSTATGRAETASTAKAVSLRVQADNDAWQPEAEKRQSSLDSLDRVQRLSRTSSLVNSIRWSDSQAGRADWSALQMRVGMMFSNEMKPFRSMFAATLCHFHQAFVIGEPRSPDDRH